MDVSTLKIRDMRKLLDDKKISATELTKEYLTRINKYNKDLEVYITVSEEKALKDAEKAQEIIDSGKASDLTGIPIAIKDNIFQSLVYFASFLPFFEKQTA